MSSGEEQLERILEGIGHSVSSPVYLIVGDRVLSEPVAERLASALASPSGASVTRHHRPAGLLPLLSDLRTYALFESAKVTLVTDSGVVADRKAAVELLDEVAAVLPLGDGGELSDRQTEAGGRLLEALRLFGIDPQRETVSEAVAALPDWALAGRHRRRKKQEKESLRTELELLLEKSRAAGIEGWVATDLAELTAIVEHGLPGGHALILAESHVALDHPLVALLRQRQALVELAGIAAERGGSWRGLEALGAELTKETGTAISRDALSELARRTLRQEGGRGTAADTASTSRFAGEYRKLAAISGGREISLEDVKEAVGDRGEEDVWQILDAIGAGRPEQALSRYRRYLASAPDPLAARLSFFSLLGSFSRHLVALGGMMTLKQIPGGVTSYPQFKARLAGELCAEPDEGMANPLAGIHPYRLHRAYLAASRLPEKLLPRLPHLVLETERAIKGDSVDPDTAITRLIVALATGSVPAALYR